ncbi:MAG: diguanylate cyclase, partial [Hyphomicrobium denitrificans]|nr:diguanylate cyclase [Hyphomicrobium denitrificans]
ERIKSDKADVFRITLEPGQTITYVAELAGEHFSRLYLWKPIDYEIKSRDRQLFNGAMLGLTGLLAIFLTAIFAANHKLIFPAAALVSWTVLSYLCVDFGFFHKLFNLRPEDNAVYRAAGEAAMASSFVIFLSTFLRLGLWHGMVRMMIGVWMVAQLTLIAVAVIDPRLAATFARLSFLMIGGVGGLFTLFLAFKGQDRALSLVPTWLLLLVWIFATGMTLSGRMSGDVVVSSLIAGLVLVVILMGFTVTQYAFRSSDAAYAGAPTELQGRSLALAASGSTVWEWNIRRDEIKVSPEVEIALSLMPGELSTKVEDFLRHVHPTDKERFRVMMMSAQERSGVRIRTDFRLRHSDNSWRWFELEAASVPNSDGRTLRCVGLLRDVSDMKRAHERLLHDAVNCSLTGLPNRELFLDRLKGVVSRAKTDGGVRPAVIFIDLDKFKSINSSFGLVRGDSLLLTVARRLQRHLGPHDTVARVGGDQFAMLFVGEREARNLPALAERVRRSLRAPIPFANQEVILTGSIGVAAWDENQSAEGDLLKDAELAMYRAKRSGADRIEVFDASMRRDRDSNIGAELAKAIEKGQLKVVYQPIVYLPTKELAGFEAFARWEHPKLGLVNPASVIDEANEPDAMVK